jgi:hypothetical protein
MDIRLKLFLVVLVALLALYLRFPHSSRSRCVFPEDVFREYKNVDKSDGVNEKEAGLVAQYEFIQRGVNNFFLNLFNGVKSKDDTTWLVTFQAYADGPESGQALDVCVDKWSGSITCWNKRPLVIKKGPIENHGGIVTRRIQAE